VAKSLREGKRQGVVMNQHQRDSRQIAPTRGALPDDGSPNENDRFEITPARNTRVRHVQADLPLLADRRSLADVVRAMQPTLEHIRTNSAMLKPGVTIPDFTANCQARREVPRPHVRLPDARHGSPPGGAAGSA
jgi:hypothetical protein